MEYRINVSEKVDDSAWDDYVYQSMDGHYTQMALWARIKAVQGWKPIRITYWDEERLVGGAQILWRTVGMNIRMGYVSKGPLLSSEDPDFIRLVIRDIQKIAQEYQLVYLAVQPPSQGQHIETLLPGLDMDLNHQGDIEKPATIRIDLTPDVEGILQNIHSNKRKWIRHVIRDGFEIQDGTRDCLPDFYQMHQHTGEKNTFDVQSIEFFQTLWDAFTPRNMVHLFFCSYEGKFINTSMAILYHDTIESYRFGWTGEYAKLHPNEALIWQKILWGKDHGFHWLDFGGLELDITRHYLETGKIPEEMLHTYSANKLHYGGEIQIFPQTYEYIYHPVMRSAYKTFTETALLRRILTKSYRFIRNR